MKRIIFFAEAVTLAHVARCVALANQLFDTGNYIIALAADNRYDDILGKLSYQRIALKSISSQYFLNRLSKGDPIYTVDILSSYIEEELKIIKEFAPDFIFGDFRLSLAISSKLTKIPYATITNAYWSPYAVIDYPIPEIPLTKVFGVTVAQKLFNIFKPAIFKIHALAFNNTCKKFGVPTLSYDMREIYTHADYTLYADFESLIPMKNLPNNHLFIGPVLWSVNVSLPGWWHQLPSDKPIVFITLGSSGDNSLLPMMLEALSKLAITVICVTAKLADVRQQYANVYIAEYLPAKDAVKKSDIVICNGGSPMVYQSLIENKPVIGIPHNLDQYLMMSQLQAKKKGVMIRAGKVNSTSICEAVENAVSVIGKKDNSLPEYSESLAIDKIESLIESVIS